MFDFIKKLFKKEPEEINNDNQYDPTDTISIDSEGHIWYVKTDRSYTKEEMKSFKGK